MTTGTASVPTLQLSSKLVLLDAVVAEKKSGKLFNGFRLEDFSIKEDGVPQTLRYLSQDTLPLSLVLLFDITGSVQPQLKDLAGAAQEVLQHLKPEDEVAVMTFSSSVKMVQPFTRDKTLLSAALELTATKSTREGTFIDEDIYEAIDAALSSSVMGSRHVLVFFTDGTSNPINRASRKFYGKEAPKVLHTRSESEEKVLKTGVSVSVLIDRSIAGDATILQFRANPLSYLVGVNPQMGELERYATLTGGPVLNGGKHDAAAKLAALLDQIHQRYTLGFVPTAPHPDGTFCHLSLELTPVAQAAHPELKQGSYIVKARSGYYR